MTNDETEAIIVLYLLYTVVKVLIEKKNLYWLLSLIEPTYNRMWERKSKYLGYEDLNKNVKAFPL